MAKQTRDHAAERMSMIKLAKAMCAVCENETDRRVFVGLINDGIFQREHIQTGLSSPEANLLPYSKRTKEHFYGRKKSAEELYELLSREPHVDDGALYDFIVERSQVHFVTKKQNMALREYHKLNPNATHEEAYAACEITLVQKLLGKRGRKPKCSKT